MHFFEKILLIGGDGTRVFQRAGERQRIAYAPEIFEQSLNSDSREMLHDGDKEPSGAILVLHKSFADPGFICKILGGIRKDRWNCLCSLDGFDEGFWSDGKQCFLCVLRDHLVGVVRKNGENFGPICRAEMRSAGTYGKFAFTRSATVFQIRHDFRAE